MGVQELAGGTKSLVWASLGAGAALMLMGLESPPPERSEQLPELALLKGRLARLEEQLAAAEAKSQRRDAELEQRLNAVTDYELWSEAAQLGVVRELARHDTGLSPKQEQRLAVAIVREARANGLDPLLVTAVIRVESTFNSFAVSEKGAIGLMQIMPATGEWLSQKRNEPLRSARHLFEFERNVQLGASYLRELIDRFGSEEAALLAYNAGPGYAKKILSSDPDTRKKWLNSYANKVLGEYARLKRRTAREGSSAARATSLREPRAEM